MENVTTEQIDDVIDNAILNATDEYVEKYFQNVDAFKGCFEKMFKFPDDNNLLYQVSFDFAALQTAMNNCIDILRESLKELLCEPSGNKRNEKREGENNV